MGARHVLFGFAVGVVLAAGCDRTAPTEPDAPEAAVVGPQPAAKGLDADGTMHLSEEDRCPVCAMRPAEHADFACAIELKDGRTFAFCGTGCMIRSWLHPEVHLGVGREQLGRAVVRDWLRGEPLDASAAIWVAGSDVVGPMGPALVPLRDEADLEVFRARHGGTDTFRLDELDDARWLELTGKPAG